MELAKVKKWSRDRKKLTNILKSQRDYQKLPRSFENHLNFILKSSTHHKSHPDKNAITIPILKIGLLKKTKSLLFYIAPHKKDLRSEIYTFTLTFQNP